jgi:dipeptidyl aminopeptidase/acylaminoacyl peptidase
VQGTVEIDEQVRTLREVCARMPHALDTRRVCMFGWSYGGYACLHALARYAHVYCAVVAGVQTARRPYKLFSYAGAPVTDWLLYDTAYTERFMGMPGDAYTASSVLARAAFMPDECGRLLICHGVRDENVHIQHTLTFIAELVAHEKPYDIQVGCQMRVRAYRFASGVPIGTSWTPSTAQRRSHEHARALFHVECNA